MCVWEGGVRGAVRYLDHVNPFPNIEEASFTGDVVQQQHAFGAPEVGLCDAAEPSKSS